MLSSYFLVLDVLTATQHFNQDTNFELKEYLSQGTTRTSVFGLCSEHLLGSWSACPPSVCPKREHLARNRYRAPTQGTAFIFCRYPLGGHRRSLSAAWFVTAEIYVVLGGRTLVAGTVSGLSFVNRTPSHVTFLVFHRTHFNVAHNIGSRWLSASRHPCFMRSVCSDLSSTLHFALFTLSHLPFHSPDVHLHLPCGLVRGEVPCALPRMRSQALWPTTILSQVMSPTSSTTTTSQRPLKSSSKSPPATAGPRRPSNLHDWEISDYTIGRALSSPLFTQEARRSSEP